MSGPAPDHEEELRRLVDRILASETFRRAPASRRLLAVIAETSSMQPDERPDQYELADRLHGSTSESDVDRVRRGVADLRKRLARWGSSEGSDEPFTARIPAKSYGLELVRREPPAEPQGSLAPEPRRRRHAFVALGALVAVGLAVAAVVGRPRGAPFQAVVEGVSLHVLNAGGEPLTTLPLPWPANPVPSTLLDRGDLDGDGIEDLVLALSSGRQHLGAAVYLVDGATRELRELFSLARGPKGASVRWTLEYQPILVRIVPDRADRPRFVLAAAGHLRGSPCHVTVASLEGEVRGTYWLHGHVNHRNFALRDVAGDPDPEVLLAARHDHEGESGAVLLVLDPARVEGHAPHPAGFPLFATNASPGSHVAYIRFPPTDLTPAPFKNHVMEVAADQGGPILLRVMESGLDGESATAVTYHLDRSFRVRVVVPEDAFEQARQRALDAGLISRPTDRAYRESLRRAVRYHDGLRWRSDPPPALVPRP